MAEEQKQELDSQQIYLNEKISTLIEKIGEGYGGPLLDELIHRLERTVADFHEEVTYMLDTLRKNSASQQKHLKNLMVGETIAHTDVNDETPEDVSDWEKRLEAKPSEVRLKNETLPAKKQSEEPKKKKSFFKRKEK